MNASFVKSPILLSGVVASLVAVASLESRNDGVESNVGGSPANLSSQLQSCAACHGSSAPFAGRSNAPTTTLTVSKLALSAGEVATVTTAVSGGVSGSTGGFACEATAGAFSIGSNTRIINSSSSITHLNRNSRSWTYSYTAPATSGPVELTSVGMTSNGGGSSGDEFSFNGFDPNATSGTPVRLYVLPNGVTNVGQSCADGFGNFSVLGANSVPNVGNSSFGFELIGATPASFAVLFVGINPPGFAPVPLDALLGLTGCFANVGSLNVGLSAPTSGGSAARAEGAAMFGFPIPNNPGLSGAAFGCQALYIDPSVAASRALPFSLSNGLLVTMQ